MSPAPNNPKIFLKLLSGILSLICILLFLTPMQEFLSVQVSRPLEYKFRAFLHKSPSLDARLKIFSFDDMTLGALGYPDLTVNSWVRLITHLAQSKPKAIYIDKLFALPLQERIYDPLKLDQAQEYVKQLTDLQIPLISGGFISRVQLPNRQLLSLFHQAYLLKKVMNADQKGSGVERSWPPVEAGYFYGPHPYLRDAFRIGHMTNAELGYAKPFFRIDESSIIPHAAFLAMGEIRINDESLYLGEQKIPLNRRNLIPINFSKKQEYFAQTKSLKAVLDRIEAKVPEPKIGSDDIVVILPAMYTGNADFKDSPVGRLQGGYFGVALLNSLLQNSWLVESFAYDLSLLLVSLALAAALALFVRPLLASLGLMFLGLSLPFVGLTLFAYQGICLSWLWASLSATFVGLVVLIERMRSENHRSQILATTLRGALSPELAESLAQNPKLLHGDPVEQIVSIMFVDIVGFSMTTERLTAKESFQQLKNQIEYIVEKIHKFGGLVDKSLGDGVLAFFGYHFEKGQALVGHADQALHCAIEIQREALLRAETLKATGRPIFPLRIGINTATVYIGNLGTEGRIDFTLIGNGVNFTARLENACTPFQIMMGLSTSDLLAQFSPREAGMLQREIRIKHHKKPILCFEYNPFHAEQHKVQAVMQYYIEFHKLYTNEPRWYFEPEDYVKVMTRFGEAQLVNFSEGGVALLSASLLAPGERIDITLDQTAGKRKGPSVLALVCWNKELEGGKVLHGCQFLQYPAEAREAFVQGLRHDLQQHGKRAQILPRNKVAS